MTCGIYRIANLIVDRRYFGQSIKVHSREWHHFSMLKRGCHDNIHLQRAWNKYGEDAFEFTVMLECEHLELTEYEQYFVDSYPPEKLYNICLECVDSHKGVIRSQVTRQKMSDSRNKYFSDHPEAHKGKNHPGFGRHRSEETKQKISESKRGENHPLFGKKHTDKTKQKMSLAAKERFSTPEAHQKFSERMKKYWADKKLAHQALCDVLRTYLIASPERR